MSARFGLTKNVSPTVDRAALVDSHPYQLCPECDGLVLVQGAASCINDNDVETYLLFACPLCGAQWAYILTFRFTKIVVGV